MAEEDADAVTEELLVVPDEGLDELDELQPAAKSAAHSTVTAAALRGMRPARQIRSPP